MRRLRRWSVASGFGIAIVVSAAGAARAQDGSGAGAVAPTGSSGIYTLGAFARDLSATPGAVDAVFAKIGAGGSTTAGPVSDAARAGLQQVLTTGNFAALDTQPRVTLAEMGAALDALGVKKPYQAPTDPAPARESLGIPTGAAPPAPAPGTDLGYGVTMGGEPPAAANEALAADSTRLASVMDRLSLNRPGEQPAYVIRYKGERITTPDALIAALRKSGHTVTITDERRVANFADLSKDGRSVAAPVWVKTGDLLPDGTEVVLPAPHAQLAISVTGPDVNAKVTFFNGIDMSGPTSGYRFRPNTDALPADWVGGKTVNTYTGDETVRAVQLMGELRRDAEDQVRANKLPDGGYFTLGVCSLAPAVVEKALRGQTTLWPLTEDLSYFQGDDAVNKIIRSLPVDGRGATPDPTRLLASVPWSDPATIPFPALRAQVTQLTQAVAALPKTPGLTRAIEGAGK
jgi:hypothetical protein